jgi:hypothetical protein
VTRHGFWVECWIYWMLITRDYTVQICLTHTSLLSLLQTSLSVSWLRLPNQTLWDSRPEFFYLNPCGHSPYVTSFLTRGWVCRLQLLLVLNSAVILRSESRGTHDQILLAQIRDSPNLDDQVPRIYIPREQGGPVILPGTGFHFGRFLRLAGLRWRHSTP